jgi:uncharacterized PurR-regulated membrane protein YhhQ (DUF165 family)
MKKYLALIGYLLTIPVANWMIQNIGTQGFPDGPHTIPVGFGYQAPSGVLLIGVALALRDHVQEKAGRNLALAAIAVGICLSYIVNPAVATASAAAFAVSELIDFAIYTKIRRRNKPAAIATSGIIGGVIDSLIFLQIAFGSTMFWQGQVIGKTAVAVVAALMFKAYRDLSNRLLASKN